MNVVTGGDVDPAWNYVGTYHMDWYVGHVFEVPKGTE
jgi:hypothetical protein